MRSLQSLLIFVVFFLTISKRSEAQLEKIGELLDRFKDLAGLLGQGGQTGSNAAEREYVGCFQDIGEIPYKSYDTSMTVEKCVKSCPKDAQNRRLAGVKYRWYCYCGDAEKFETSLTKRSYKKAASDCNENCGGGGSLKCGGSITYSVYLQTEREREGYVKEMRHKGCWSDPFAKLQYDSYDAQLTPEKCVGKCFIKDRSISATKLGVYCYCGNGNAMSDLRVADKQADAKCNRNCNGVSEPCGDTLGLYYSVYEQVEVKEGEDGKIEAGSFQKYLELVENLIGRRIVLLEKPKVD